MGQGYNLFPERFFRGISFQGFHEFLPVPDTAAALKACSQFCDGHPVGLVLADTRGISSLPIFERGIQLTRLSDVLLVISSQKRWYT